MNTINNIRQSACQNKQNNLGALASANLNAVWLFGWYARSSFPCRQINDEVVRRRNERNMFTNAILSNSEAMTISDHNAFIEPLTVITGKGHIGISLPLRSIEIYYQNAFFEARKVRYHNYHNALFGRPLARRFLEQRLLCIALADLSTQQRINPLYRSITQF